MVFFIAQASIIIRRDDLFRVLTVEYTKRRSQEEGSPCGGECSSTVSSIQLHGSDSFLQQSILPFYVEMFIFCVY